MHLRAHNEGISFDQVALPGKTVLLHQATLFHIRILALGSNADIGIFDSSVSTAVAASAGDSGPYLSEGWVKYIYEPCYVGTMPT